MLAQLYPFIEIQAKRFVRGSRLDYQDITQQVSLKIHMMTKSDLTETEMKKIITTVTRNHVIDESKKLKREILIPDLGETFSQRMQMKAPQFDLVFGKQFRGEILSFSESLPNKEKEFIKELFNPSPFTLSKYKKGHVSIPVNTLCMIMNFPRSRWIALRAKIKNHLVYKGYL